MDILKSQGYLLLKNQIDDYNIIKAKNSIGKNTVNYKYIEEYNNIIFSKINNILNMDLKCSKYRVSNNNNSTDAGQFHKDLKITNEKYMNNADYPIYTVVTYLDKSIMELIPYSHKNYSMNIIDSFKHLINSKKIIVNPGDILIFYSSIIHRGVFTIKNKNRRIIQNFGCIPKNQFEFYNNKISHVSCQNNWNKNIEFLGIEISKNKIFNTILNFISYINVSTGYSSIWKHHKRFNCKFDFYESEANNPRLILKYNKPEQINRYIIKQPNLNNNCSNNDFYFHNGFYINFYLIIFIFILFLIIFLSYLIIFLKNMKNKK